MPNSILKAHLKPLETRIDEIATQIKTATNMYYNTRHIELFYSTPEQLEIADECLQWAKKSQISVSNPSVCFVVELTHPNTPEPKRFNLLYNLDHIYMPGATATLWPANVGNLRHDIDAEQFSNFIQKVTWMTQQRVGIALLRKVMDFMLDTCKTYEQIRWNFPPISAILRGMDKDFRKIAHDLEQNKARLNMPPLEVSERRLIRYVCEFWATHELLDTFHKENNAPAGTKWIDACSASLDFGDGYQVLIQ